MIYSGSLNSKVTKREEENDNLALKIAKEGIVLLENDNTLPLKTKELALYGLGAIFTCFGGTGSGEVRSRFKINILDGFLNHNIKVLSTNYLKELKDAINISFNKYKKELKQGIKKTKLTNILDYAGSHPFIFNEHIKIKEKLATDTAIYVIRREVGEGGDRKLVKGDMYLSDDERTDILTLKEMYQKVIVIINSPLLLLDFDIKVNALVYMSFCGQRSGDALASLILGESNFSAALTTSIAKYDNLPVKFKESLNDNYEEGIYVGYRYYTTFNKEVIYPFGYGLSYSNFRINYLDIKIDNSRIKVSFNITNLSKIKGKKILALYLSPLVKDREKIMLVAFNKTKELAYNESEILELSFDIGDFARFKDNKYLLDKAKYKLSYGLDITKLTSLCYLDLKEDIVVEEVKNLGFNLVNELTNDFDYEIEKLPIYDLNIEYKTKINDYKNNDIKLNDKKQKIYNKLNIKNKIRLLIGESYIGKPYYKTFGACGNTTAKFKKIGLPNLVLADGPQGLNLAKESYKPLFKFINIPVLPEALYYTTIGKILSLRKVKKTRNKKVYYQFTTSFPSALTLAQTWSKELAYLEGLAIKKEMLEYHINYLLAPAINIIRDPLGGRNYEYYSEDPYLSGSIGLAFSQGVSSSCTKVVLKHYTCNNREYQRNQISSNLSERTFREIYLKPFKIIITNINNLGVMSSYNKVNGSYVSISNLLIKQMLKEELKLKGIVMTDWFGTGHDEAKNYLAIKAGTNFIMPGIFTIRKEIYKAYKKGLIKEEEINQLIKEILYYCYN